MPDLPKSKHALPGRLEAILATVSEYLAARKETLLLRVLVNSRYSVQEEWSHDNWDGGIWGHAITFHVPRALFPELIGQSTELGQQLRQTINEIKAVQSEFIEEVFFEVEPGERDDWRAASGALLSHDSAGAVLTRDDETHPWAPNQPRLFLSHPSAVKVAANDLKRELTPYGISAFVAHEDIEPTAIWQREIERALATMHALIAIAAPPFRASQWCQQEVGWALGRGVPIISLRAGEDPPGFIGASQALAANLTKQGVTAREIVKLLAKEARTAALLRESLVSRIERVENWEILRDLIDCLVTSPDAAADQLDRLERAFKSNTHLASSHSLPILKTFISERRQGKGQ